MRRFHHSADALAIADHRRLRRNAVERQRFFPFGFHADRIDHGIRFNSF